MANEAAGFECPDCLDSYRNKDVLAYIYDDDGIEMIGYRLHCRVCEESWDVIHATE